MMLANDTGLADGTGLVKGTGLVNGTGKSARSIDLALPIEFCPSCQSDQPFQTPPCAEDHGLECPDRACTSCGLARVLPSMAGTPAVSSVGRAA